MSDPSSSQRSASARRLVTGLVIVVVGIAVLMANLGVRLTIFDYPHWWALCLLVLALVPLIQAVQRYRRQQRFDAQVGRSALAALTLITLGAGFIAGTAWHVWWPVFVVYAGLWVMLKPR